MKTPSGNLLVCKLHKFLKEGKKEREKKDEMRDGNGGEKFLPNNKA